MSRKSFISSAFMVPNDLIDHGHMVSMKGPALACYLFIVRKTRGWNKDQDNISISQLVKATGYNKDSVLKGVDKLVAMGVVERKSFSNQPAKYELTDAIFAVDILDSENIAGENIECAVDILDSTHSKDSTHNNKQKTTNNKNKKSTSSEKNNSKAVSHDSNLNLNLSDKQIDYFANLLANDPNFGSTHAVVGESGKEFAARIKKLMKDPTWVAEHMDDLKAVGFGGVV